MQKPMQNLKIYGHKVVGSDEEGLIANHHSMMKERINENCLDPCGKIFYCWNKTIR